MSPVTEMQACLFRNDEPSPGVHSPWQNVPVGEVDSTQLDLSLFYQHPLKLAAVI